MATTNNYRFSVIAYAPDLQGCNSQGDSYEQVVENIKDSIRLHVEDLKVERPAQSPAARTTSAPV
jgi:predicted RNase H-like HicB family nuclease